MLTPTAQNPLQKRLKAQSGNIAAISKEKKSVMSVLALFLSHLQSIFPLTLSPISPPTSFPEEKTILSSKTRYKLRQNSLAPVPNLSISPALVSTHGIPPRNFLPTSLNEIKQAVNSILEFASTSALSKNGELANSYFKSNQNALRKMRRLVFQQK